MRKKRFLAFWAVLLLLLSLAACRKEEEPTPATPDGSATLPSQIQTNTKPPVPNPDGDPAGTEESEADYFLSQNGYPYGFTLRFAANGRGFDTGAGQLFDGSATTAYDFSAKLASLYYDMTEQDIYTICNDHSDLTYAALSDGAAPTGSNVLYTISFTDNGTTYQVKVDSAAIAAYPNNPRISQMQVLIADFSGFTDLCFQNVQ